MTSKGKRPSLIGDELWPGRCPICGDIGYLVADGQAFARYCDCERGQEVLAERAERFGQRTGLSGWYRRARFGDFSADNGILRAARDLIEHGRFEQEGGAFTGVYLYGRVGVGKTALAAAMVNEAVSRGHSACLITVIDLLDKLRAAFHPKALEPEYAVLQRFKDVWLLALDDIGAQKASPWVVERLQTIIDHRLAAELPTVVTSNLPPAAIADRLSDADDFAGQRVMSRLMGMCWMFEIRGRDRRIRG